MSERFYSPSTGGFYSTEIHGERMVPEPQTAREIKAGKRPAMIANPDCTIPADAVPVSAERHAELMEATGNGAELSARGGKPVATDRVIGAGEHAAGRRLRRDRLLAGSDWTQLPDSPIGTELRAAWAAYRAALRDLDMAGTDWPAAPVTEGEPA